MSRVVEINNFNEHEAFINNNSRGVLFFGSMSCPHCHDMVQFVNDLSVKYPNVKFGPIEVSKVDVDNVDGVPVFVGYKSRQPVDVVLGARKNALEDMVKNKLS